MNRTPLAGTLATIALWDIGGYPNATHVYLRNPAWGRQLADVHKRSDIYLRLYPTRVVHYFPLGE